MLTRSHAAARLLSLLLLAVTASRASAAQGLNLSWSHCQEEGTGTQNRTFACDSNVGTDVMVGSFVLERDMSQVIGTEVVLDLASASEVLPNWWLFDYNNCRENSISANFVANATDVVCADWANGQAVGGLGSYCTVYHPCPNVPTAANVAIIKVVSAVPPDAARTLAGGVDYFDFNAVINRASTVGPARCLGCDVPVCIVLNSINVVAQNNAEHRFLATPTVPGSNFVTWQGGGGVSVGGKVGCPAATPTRRSTWSDVKTLYR